MNTEKTKQDDQTQPKNKKWRVLVAIISALAIIIAALIPVIYYIVKNSEVEMTISLVIADEGKYISGSVFIDDDKNPTPINERGTTIPLKKGKHTIHAESKGYRKNDMTIDRIPKSIEIKMEPIPIPPSGQTPLSFAGWTPWELRINIGAQNNEVIVNGNLDDAGGFFKNGLADVLRGRTLILYFANVNRSDFSMERMVKLTYNRNDATLTPTNESTSNGGYIPKGETPLDRGIEYPIPDNFDGKLGFVFYQANLRDLRITAFYR